MNCRTLIPFSDIEARLPVIFNILAFGLRTLETIALASF